MHTKSYRMTIKNRIFNPEKCTLKIQLDLKDFYLATPPTSLSIKGSQQDMLLSKTPAHIELSIDGHSVGVLPPGARFGNVAEQVREFERWHGKVARGEKVEKLESLLEDMRI